MNTLTRTMASLAILLTMTLSNTVGAEEIFFTVKNTQGVSFPGEVTQSGFEGKLQAVKFEGEFAQDGGSAGTPNRIGQGGILGPAKITKKLGAASPAFYQALKDGQHLKVTLEFWRPSRAGKVINSHRLTLNNALVTGIRNYSEPLGKQLGHMIVLEEVTISFQSFEMRDLLKNSTSSSSAPKPKRRFRR